MSQDDALLIRLPNHVYAPAFKFYGDFDEYEITDYLKISRHCYVPTNFDKEALLSGDEINAIRSTDFCFEINEKIPGNLNPEKILNTLLLAIWILRPSQVYIGYRFGPGEGDFSRLLDQFICNSAEIQEEEYSLNDLAGIKGIFVSLLGVLERSGRLSNAFDLTFRSCMAYSSLVAHVLSTAALETLLTYKRGKGLTARLATSFACLTSHTQRARERAFRKFCAVYDFRSDIMHGRVPRISRDRHLRNLKMSADCLRLTWRKVLEDATLMKVLEGRDSEREHLFARLESRFRSSRGNAKL